MHHAHVLCSDWVQRAPPPSRRKPPAEFRIQEPNTPATEQNPRIQNAGVQRTEVPEPNGPPGPDGETIHLQPRHIRFVRHGRTLEVRSAHGVLPVYQCAPLIAVCRLSPTQSEPSGSRGPARRPRRRATHPPAPIPDAAAPPTSAPTLFLSFGQGVAAAEGKSAGVPGSVVGVTWGETETLQEPAQHLAQPLPQPLPQHHAATFGATRSATGVPPKQGRHYYMKCRGRRPSGNARDQRRGKTWNLRSLTGSCAGCAVRTRP